MDHCDGIFAWHLARKASCCHRSGRPLTAFLNRLGGVKSSPPGGLSSEVASWCWLPWVRPAWEENAVRLDAAPTQPKRKTICLWCCCLTRRGVRTPGTKTLHGVQPDASNMHHIGSSTARPTVRTCCFSLHRPRTQQQEQQQATNKRPIFLSLHCKASKVLLARRLWDCACQALTTAAIRPSTLSV